MLFPEIIWGQETTTSRKAWKRDLKIYDLPGWNSYTYNFPYAGGIRKRGDNEIVVQFETADSSGINDDFYVEHHRRVTLSSKDYGTTWKEIQPDWQYSMPLRLSDGTLVEVVHATTLRTPEQQKSRLERLGIGHIWRDDCHMPWDIWPSHMAEELRERGMLIWDIRVGSASPFDIYLPEATIATHAPSDLFSRVSTDNGKSWKVTKVLDGTPYQHMACMFTGATVLPDDTILIPGYAEKKHQKERASEVFALRSTDGGKTFQKVVIGGTHLNECTLVQCAEKHVIAVIRSSGLIIHRSASTDGGLSWSPPRETGMSGAPLHAIALQSGDLLCVYAHRLEPAQVRATLSRDQGMTWDIANTKILCQGLPAQYTALGGAGQFIGGPGAIQLDDGTIFVYYSIPDVQDIRPGTIPQGHSFITGNVFSPEFLSQPTTN